MTTIREVVTAIQTRRSELPPGRALLALSGIDGSGKGNPATLRERDARADQDPLGTLARENVVPTCSL